MKLLGTKYQTYIDDKLVVLRLVNIKNENKFIVVDESGNKISMNKEELDACIKLENDAVMNIMATVDADDYNDVYACIHRIEDLKQNRDVPVMIIRQNTFSTSKNTFASMDKIYVGECITIVGCTNDEERQALLEFEDIKYTLQVALYVDDKFDDIMKCIPNNKINKINDYLHLIHTKFLEAQASNGSADMIDGYCETFEELLTTNNFMYNYRSIFNILQVDFPIDLGDNCTDDGVITLNNKQIKLIENTLQMYIKDVKVVKYDKDIDVSKLINNTHVMISDSNYDIYLINYTIIERYPIDNDVLRAMTALGK